MKRCAYCGHEYSDDYSVCRIDQTPLESCESQPPLDSNPADELDLSASSKRFRFLGSFEPFEARQLLGKFEAAGVRFQIDFDKKRVFTAGGRVSGAGYVRSDQIKIFVIDEDEQKAAEIISADWKV